VTTLPPLAVQVLAKLCDRLDANPAPDRRVSVAMPDRALGTEEAEQVYDSLKRAEAAGAVALEWGRLVNTAHILERVVLKDGAALFAFVGRVPLADKLSAAEARLRPEAGVASTAVLDRLLAAWAERKRPAQLGPDEVEETAFALRVVDAFAAHDGREIDMRTFSAQRLGNSKAIERDHAAVARILRFAFDLPAGLDAEDVTAFFGVRKFAQPRLVAGPLTIDGVRVPAEPYLGLPSELLPRVAVVGRPRSILTIENLASFNRHVREVRTDDDVVLYTAGFCGRELLDLVARLAAETGAPVFHWGDIDHGGLLIGRQLEKAVGRVTPHLMTPALARARGTPAPATDVLSAVPEGSAFRALAEYLASDEAHRLEQEVFEPQCPGT